MASFNQLQLIGRLGKDPETRYTTQGTGITHFSVATSKKRDGEERTEWHDIVTFGKTAEFCAQYLAKGREVFVQGELQSREYVDKNGIKRKTWEVVADKVQALGSGKRDDDRPSTAQAVWQGSGPPKTKQADEPPAFESDPIPF